VLSKLLCPVATSEFVYLTCSVEHFLLARVKRVAEGAHFDAEIFASC